jgi:flavin-dependent dehydrogenase
MKRYFHDPDQMIYPKDIIHASNKTQLIASELFSGVDSSTDYKHLQREVRAEGETIPPLFNAYIGLTHTMRFFGSIFDPDFGRVYETGIMITMADLLETKQKRYVEPYREYLKKVLAERKLAKKLAKEKKLEEKSAKKSAKIEKKTKLKQLKREKKDNE